MRHGHFADRFKFWEVAPRFGGSAPAGNTTTTQTQTPWSGQQPYLQSVYEQANVLDGTTPSYYPGQTYQPLTGTQQSLMSDIIGQGANGGDSAINSANNYASSALSPSYTAGTQGGFNAGESTLQNELSPSYLNPWNSSSFQTVVNNTLASALPAATAGFTNGNRSDSGLATAAATNAATNAVGNLAQSQYNTNQQIQNQAAGTATQNYLTQQGQQANLAGLAPLIDQTQMGDLSSALNTAGMSQTDLQNQINANMNAWNYEQMLPWNQLGMYESAITGAGSNFGTTATTQPYYTNPTADAVGTVSSLGTAGAAIYAAIAV